MSASDQSFFADFSKALLEKEPASAPQIFEGGAKNIAAGIAVYRNNVRTSLSRALGDKFPVVRKLVGEEFFKFLAHEYFSLHPPTSPVIARYGDALPGFLETFKPAQNYPYLADVARLEMAWLEAYHAADAEVMKAADIIAAAGDEFESRAIIFHPSLRLLSSPFPIASIWGHNRSGVQNEKLRISGSENVLVARPHREVFVQTLTPGAFTAIAALGENASIAEALTVGSNADPQFSPQSFFERLLQFDIITGITPGQNKGSAL